MAAFCLFGTILCLLIQIKICARAYESQDRIVPLIIHHSCPSDNDEFFRNINLPTKCERKILCKRMNNGIHPLSTYGGEISLSNKSCQTCPNTPGPLGNDKWINSRIYMRCLTICNFFIYTRKNLSLPFFTIVKAGCVVFEKTNVRGCLVLLFF